MFKQEKEETEPLWLSKDNDHLHQSEKDDESEKLFGSGSIPLEGEVKQGTDGNTLDDVESQHSNYGSINEKTSIKSNDSTSRSQASRGKKKKNSKKQSPPPPTSVFDDSVNNGSLSDDDDMDSGTALTYDGRPHMPRRNWCVEFFRIVSAVTVISSMGLLVTQLIPLFTPISSESVYDSALKAYLALFCVLFILVEIDVPLPFIRTSNLLQNFISRGFIYSFLGLICLEESYSERVKALVKENEDKFHVAWASLFMQISSWLIEGCGVLYMLMGILCLQKLRDRIKKKDRDVWRRYRKELREWKRLNPS